MSNTKKPTVTYDTWLDRIELTGEPDSPNCRIYGKTVRAELALIAICSHVSPISISERSAQIWRLVLKQSPPDIGINRSPIPPKTNEQPIKKALDPHPRRAGAKRAPLAAADSGGLS